MADPIDSIISDERLKAIVDNFQNSVGCTAASPARLTVRGLQKAARAANAAVLAIGKTAVGRNLDFLDLCVCDPGTPMTAADFAAAYLGIDQNAAEQAGEPGKAAVQVASGLATILLSHVADVRFTSAGTAEGAKAFRLCRSSIVSISCAGKAECEFPCRDWQEEMVLSGAPACLSRLPETPVRVAEAVQRLPAAFQEALLARNTLTGESASFERIPFGRILDIIAHVSSDDWKVLSEAAASGDHPAYYEAIRRTLSSALGPTFSARTVSGLSAWLCPKNWRSEGLGRTAPLVSDPVASDETAEVPAQDDASQSEEASV